ncbi:MAG: NAD(P)H-dependent oxidoreductase [Chlorobium sp.]|uniref:Rieske 2Fe-2S domain-containing protein n=1 Tax=Chlorobium sp. TaxID=1095 RepID=UPI0025BD58C4|nr:Rieske 2Fe-2S domain-containing protein [Chlorobium sp.]MCF8382351.1 NAD(P)H-dependent oxidoreductase [Chlorobium sp.]
MKFIAVLPLSELPPGSHRTVKAGRGSVALFNYNGTITALEHACLHKGGDLGEGFIQRLDRGALYVACPWHGWQYNIADGRAPEGYLDRQAVFEVRVEDGMILVSEKPVVSTFRAVHEDERLADLRNLDYHTTPDSLHVLGISATNMNRSLPRPSTSETALQAALDFAASEYGAETRMIRLRDLEFRHCEGYYSRHEEACTWPCSITSMNPDDGMSELYRALVLWADVVLLATPIRWGNASSLYYKMAERLNTVQNQITLHDRVLIRNKVVSFIITGGQDNVQGVAGQLNAFFSDLGFVFPPFNYLGWSRGWIAEDMQHNVSRFMKSRYVKRSVKELVTNAVQLLRQVKRIDSSRMQTPKPKISEAGGLTEQDADLI